MGFVLESSLRRLQCKIYELVEEVDGKENGILEAERWIGVILDKMYIQFVFIYVQEIGFLKRENNFFF